MFWVSRASRPWGFIVGDPPLCASIARSSTDKANTGRNAVLGTKADKATVVLSRSLPALTPPPARGPAPPLPVRHKYQLNYC